MILKADVNPLLDVPFKKVKSALMRVTIRKNPVLKMGWRTSLVALEIMQTGQVYKFVIWGK